MRILSQGDNWFVFHLLASGDLAAVKRANAHFSDDLLSSLLNEPIPGHGVYWSSAGGKSYPIPFRARSFERMVKVADPDGTRPRQPTPVDALRERFATAVNPEAAAPAMPVGGGAAEAEEPAGEMPLDALATYKREALIRFAERGGDLVREAHREGVLWVKVHERLTDLLPHVIEARERNRIAFSLMPELLEGPLFSGCRKEYRPRKKDGKSLCWIVPGPRREEPARGA